MQQIIYPQADGWANLCMRPAKDASDLLNLANRVFTAVAERGDEALYQFTLQFDKVEMPQPAVTEQEIKDAEAALSIELKEAIGLAKGAIEAFHAAQQEPVKKVETHPGVLCWRESRPIERVGIYIPGGTAPLFSTVLMLGIPARLAGCKEAVLCSPPGSDGSLHPAILYAARLAGISKVFKAGGMQAIAAMSLGTQSIPRTDKIFGPGNQYVTAAKLLAQQRGIAIDMPAGPSEVLIIANRSCRPEFVAADLLSQAEHGSDSQVILLTTEKEVLDKVMGELDSQLEALPRKELAANALTHSKAILLKDIDECIAFSNTYAPEHLILAFDQAENYLSFVLNAGSVFIGNYSCESAGDYASGTNHTLPTNGFARAYSGVSLDSFIKKISFQQLSASGLAAIGPAIEQMAAAEHLYAHKQAVSIRLRQLTESTD